MPSWQACSSIDQGGGKLRGIALTGIYGFYIMGTLQKIENLPVDA
jgi:hypothetical protein